MVFVGQGIDPVIIGHVGQGAVISRSAIVGPGAGAFVKMVKRHQAGFRSGQTADIIIGCDLGPAKRGTIQSHFVNSAFQIIGVGGPANIQIAGVDGGIGSDRHMLPSIRAERSRSVAININSGTGKSCRRHGAGISPNIGTGAGSIYKILGGRDRIDPEFYGFNGGGAGADVHIIITAVGFQSITNLVFGAIVKLDIFDIVTAQVDIAIAVQRPLGGECVSA